MQQTGPPTISIRANIWIVIPIAALIAAILTANFFSSTMYIYLVQYYGQELTSLWLLY